MSTKRSTMIPYCYCDTTVPMITATLPVGDGLIFTDMSRDYISKSCVICAQETRKSSRMNMNCSLDPNFGSMKSLATTTLEPWTRAVSRAILSVASAGSDSTGMMSCMLIAEISTKSAIFAIGGILEGSSSIMWTMIRWNFTSEKTISYV